MAVKILQIAQEKQYDLAGIHVDLNRKTGVLIRQSRKKADKNNPESRLRQETMVPVAVDIRGDEDDHNIELYDEGAGISGTKGYDERPQLSKLYIDIANDIIGSLVLARADRLFRDKHFRNVSMFTELAEKKRLKLIVPGKTIYDFTRTKDLQNFQKDMQEAYNYIATQILYMTETRQQKVMRGLYGGGHLPAPYVIEKAAWKDEQRPVLYQPWLEMSVEFFQQFYDSDFSIAYMARYIESRPYLFPLPSAEDLQKYHFPIEMTKVEKGYTFTSGASIRNYLSNLTLGGYAKVGRDELGNQILLAGAFQAAVPVDLLAPCYGAITGHYPDGTPFERWKDTGRSRKRGINTKANVPNAILHGFIKSDDGKVRYAGDYRDGKKNINHYQCDKQTGLIAFKTMWSVPCAQIDAIVLDRLCKLIEYDTDIVDRLKEVWEARKAKGGVVDEATVLQTQIEKAEAHIKHLDHLLTEPAQPLSKETEDRYIGLLKEAEIALQNLRNTQGQHIDREDPERVIPNFYYVLAHLPTEYPNLDSEHQKRMMRKVIKEISINAVSDHLLLLQIEWEDGIAARVDVALIWRGVSSNIAEKMTEEEANTLKGLYPVGSQLEIMQAFPRFSWQNIKRHAQILRADSRKPLHQGPVRINSYHRTMAWQDLQAITALAEHPYEQERMQEIANTLAAETKRGDISEHWWLSLNEISYLDYEEEDYYDISGISDSSTRRVGNYAASINLTHMREITEALADLFNLTLPLPQNPQSNGHKQVREKTAHL